MLTAMIDGMAASVNLNVDEDGFLCIVAPDDYAGFIGEDWTLDQLLARFVGQVNAENLFVAYPGPDHADDLLTVDAAQRVSTPYRQVSGVVRVGPQGLWLTDYAQLSMAAQFADESPLAEYSTRLPVLPGRYLITLAQETVDGDEFTLSWQPADSAAVSRCEAVQWFV